MLIIALLLIILSVFFCFFLSNLIQIKFGTPPILDRIHIAYRYVYKVRNSEGNAIFNKLSTHFPGKKLIRICYSGTKSQKTEFAQGVILPNTLTEDVDRIVKFGYSLFAAPSITYSLYAVYPVLPWFPLTRWVPVLIGYPKINAMIQKYNLCAYPVIEIYSKFTLTIVVPLHSQDDFVVNEAEKLVYGRNYSALLKSPSLLNMNTTSNGVKGSGKLVMKEPRTTKG